MSRPGWRPNRGPDGLAGTGPGSRPGFIRGHRNVTICHLESWRHGTIWDSMTTFARLSPQERSGAPRDELERLIARFVTQRECIDFAARIVNGLPGAVLEIGLGKGWAGDHIRQAFPGREFIAFDRSIHCESHLIPERQSLYLGDFRETLPRVQGRLGRGAAVVHAGIGSGNEETDAGLVHDIGPMIAALVRQGGVVLSDLQMPFDLPRWRRLPLPAAAVEAGWPYFIWQAMA